MIGRLLLILATIFSPMPWAWAGEARPAAADAALEERVTAVASELRCLVCQNQTLADSNADLAIDLRNQVREKLAAGMSDRDVTEFMVERYGEFVLYRPPVKGTTWLLWFGPFLLLLGGIGFLLMKVVRRPVQTDNLPEADRQRAAALLDDTHNTKEKA
jgi:cytochrome c-type biogenesis protein CcmH